MKLYYLKHKIHPNKFVGNEDGPLIVSDPDAFPYLVRPEDLFCNEIKELSQKEVIDMFAEESFEYYKKELEKAYQKLINIPVHYIVVEKLKDVPFGEYYLKQRKRRK